MLGQRPDEFGLIPDEKGFVPIKELLKAIHEEKDFRYVRASHINEILIGKDRYLFESTDKLIRVKEKKWQLDLTNPARLVPKILYTGVKRKTCMFISDKGLKSAINSYIILSPSKEFSEKIGKRRDPKPVVLTILASDAQSMGHTFYQFGSLFLSPEIGPDFISGYPIQKEPDHEKKKPVQTKRTSKTKPATKNLTPGSFIMDVPKDPDIHRKLKGKKKKGWKEEARKLRRKGR